MVDLIILMVYTLKRYAKSIQLIDMLLIWSSCIKEKSELLKHVQIEATKTVTGIRVNSSKIILYSEINLETLQSRRDNHKLIIFYKNINGLAPHDMLD